MEEHIYHSQYISENEFWWFIARNAIVYKLINHFCKLTDSDYILDAGCGTGGFTVLLNKQYRVIGLDTSEIALNYCRKRGLNDLFLGELSDFNTTNYNIKAITMLDVIEHIENDQEAVIQVHNLLNESGYLIATVPAYHWLWSKHDVAHKHFRRYTLQKIKQILTLAGFDIEYSTYFNTLLFVPAVLKRMAEKLLHLDAKSEIEGASPFVNTLFKSIFLFEKNLLPSLKFPFGLSIFIVAKKSL